MWTGRLLSFFRGKKPIAVTKAVLLYLGKPLTKSLVWGLTAANIIASISRSDLERWWMRRVRRLLYRDLIPLGFQLHNHTMRAGRFGFGLVGHVMGKIDALLRASLIRLKYLVLLSGVGVIVFKDWLIDTRFKSTPATPLKTRPVFAKRTSPSVKKTLPRIRFPFPRFRIPQAWHSVTRLVYLLVRLPRFSLPHFRLPPIRIRLPRVNIARSLVVATMFLVTISTSALAGGWWVYQVIIKDLPNPQALAYATPNLTSRIYDRNGVLLYKLYADENRSLVELGQIPEYMLQATLSIEDKDFFRHNGFSVRGIARAAAFNATAESGMQGGSTITQQLVKNTLLTTERTLVRKLKEVILSFATEFLYTKEEILEMYFNQVPYGGTAYGIQAAAQMYFGKNIEEVTLAEAAFLAGLPAAPTRYSPYGSNNQAAYWRQSQVLRLMVENGYITTDQAESAMDQELTLLTPSDPILAPHFVMFVREYLYQTYGRQVVDTSGLEVITSLDLSIQAQVETAVSEELARIGRLNVSNGAALVTNPQTGEILAMVGSRNYFDTAADGQVNVTLASRQPGSSIKPLTYAMALEKGMTPATIIEDAPICYTDPHQPPYCPKNYDNSFHGRVTLRRALANSYNIPAVKTLNEFGVKALIDQGRKMGITTWENERRFGLSLALGGGEVRMVDMAVAYGVFASGGYKTPLNPLLSVTTTDGQSLSTKICRDGFACPKEKVLDEKVAYQISDILSDNQARSQAFGTNSVLVIPGHQVAVKTGTTNSLRDNWTFGYTGEYVVGTWVGNNDNTPMSYVASGITGASPIFHSVMTNLLKEKESHSFAIPLNLIKVGICAYTGTLPCSGCPVVEEFFIEGTAPTQHCSALPSDPPAQN